MPVLSAYPVSLKTSDVVRVSRVAFRDEDGQDVDVGPFGLLGFARGAGEGNFVPDGGARAGVFGEGVGGEGGEKEDGGVVVHGYRDWLCLVGS